MRLRLRATTLIDSKSPALQLVFCLVSTALLTAIATIIVRNIDYAEDDTLRNLGTSTPEAYALIGFAAGRYGRRRFEALGQSVRHRPLVGRRTQRQRAGAK